MFERAWLVPAVFAHLLRLIRRAFRAVTPLGHVDAPSIDLRLEQIKTSLAAMLLGMRFALLVAYTPLVLTTGALETRGD